MGGKGRKDEKMKDKETMLERYRETVKEGGWGETRRTAGRKVCS